MVDQGIVYAGWDNDWLYAFLGVMLLGAVLVNNWVKQASGDAREWRADDRQQRPTHARARRLPPGRRRSSRSTTSASPTAAIAPARTSTTTVQRRARSPACSATTAPASRRSSRSWPALHAHTDGDFLVDGEDGGSRSPREALALGIATVYQDLAVVPLMPVWRNFFLGSELTKGCGPLRRLDIAR